MVQTEERFAMWSQRINGKYGALVMVPMCALIGPAHLYGGLHCLNGAICRFNDGRAAGDALLMPGCLLFVASGSLVIWLMIRVFSEPYELRLNDRGSLDVVSWLGRNRILPDEIRSIWTMVVKGDDENGDSEFVRVIHLRGYLDVPRSDRSEELISLLTSRNPSITVQRGW